MFHSDLDKGFGDISEHYRMAREILDLAGVVSDDGTTSDYVGGRIHIHGSTGHSLLTIDFDNRANTGHDYWGRAMSISSLGSIEYISQPHLSEAEAKEGRRRKDCYIKWHTFLKRKYKNIQQTQAAAEVAQCAE
jgi:hypothetical protein